MNQLFFQPKFSLGSQLGQTLIEVIIAIGLVVLVLITLVSALTLTIRNNQFARDQVLALNHSRETLEWFRSLRDQMGWDSFTQMLTNQNPPITYCLPTLPPTPTDAQNLTNHDCGVSDVIPSTSFYRNLVITLPNASEVDATVTVKWTEGGKVHQSQSTLILNKAL